MTPRRHMARVVVVVAAVVALCSPLSAASGEVELAQQVEAVERSFAKTMADRDHDAFALFLSEEAVFLSGANAERGKENVAARWERYFQGPEPPFSWEPETVEVLDSGTLALSTGPVHNSDGELISYFTSIWRQEEPGVWRIVFDKGNKACD